MVDEDGKRCANSMHVADISAMSRSSVQIRGELHIGPTVTSLALCTHLIPPTPVSLTTASIYAMAVHIVGAPWWKLDYNLIRLKPRRTWEAVIAGHWFIALTSSFRRRVQVEKAHHSPLNTP